MHRATRRLQRGQSLVVVVLVLVIVTVIAVGLVGRSSSEGDAAASLRRHGKSVSCADGAREMLLSQLSVFGANPSELVLDRVVDDQSYSSGHYDQFAVSSVVAVTGTAPSALTGVSDISNRTGASSLGGRTWRMTVVCSSRDANGAASRQTEVEFLIRFGL